MPDAALSVFFASLIHCHEIAQQYTSFQAITRRERVEVAHQQMRRPLQWGHNAQYFAYLISPDAITGAAISERCRQVGYEDGEPAAAGFLNAHFQQRFREYARAYVYLCVYDRKATK